MKKFYKTAGLKASDKVMGRLNTFTLASPKDKASRVTLNDTLLASTGRAFLVTVKYGRKTHTMYFEKNRKGSIKTTGWSKELPDPTIGNDVLLEIVKLVTFPNRKK